MTTGIISHPDCKLHEMGPYHPESPGRLDAIDKAISLSNLHDKLLHIQAPAASRQQLCLAHNNDYINSIFTSAPRDQRYLNLDSDTVMNQFSLRAAQYAAGAVIKAVDMVMLQEVNNVFCNIRPPGHHAESGRAMGFCIFNNIAVGAAHALVNYQLDRVAIIDFDVHHGNGTEEIFCKEPRVLFCSTFQHPFYPDTDIHFQREHIIKIPLAAGTTGQQYRASFEKNCLPFVDQFEPQLILISAGFDAHESDPIAQLCLDDEDYYWITCQIRTLADSHCAGKIVSSLEGGYQLGALGSSVIAHLQALSHMRS